MKTKEQIGVRLNVENIKFKSIMDDFSKNSDLKKDDDFMHMIYRCSARIKNLEWVLED